MGMSLSQSVQQLVTSVTSVIGIISMMLSINVIMTLVAIVVLPISAVLVSVVVKMSQKHFKNQQAFLGNVNGIVEETFSGQNVVKAFNKEEDILKEFNQSNKKLYEANFKSQFLSGLMMPLMMFVGNLAYVVICVLGGYLVVNGSMQVGAIQAFIGYIRNFTQPISQLAQVSNMIQTAIAAGERVFEFLENEDEKETGTKSLENIKGDIDFINVTFGYTPEKIIIKDFNYSVKAGQKVAIVGETGAGKTTIVKLLMRFYDVNSGEILIDGVNINEYKRSELRKFFGMVLQDTWLFQGTIMENLRYGRLDATDDEIIEIAKFSHAHRFISSLPDGYNTVLNEEATNISIGQKQLLTIARCYLAKSSVIILDEATSSVDTRTEWRIQRAMQKMTLGKTSFIIAHRLSTIRDADCLIKF
jgi:ATP-binding cassette subfamily B protein